MYDWLITFGKQKPMLNAHGHRVSIACFPAAEEGRQTFFHFSP